MLRERGHTHTRRERERGEGLDCYGKTEKTNEITKNKLCLPLCGPFASPSF